MLYDKAKQISILPAFFVFTVITLGMEHDRGIPICERECYASVIVGIVIG